MIEFADILRVHGKDYLKLYKNKIPQNHLKTINDILICRCKENGGQIYFCQNCKRFIYSYHSCGNRNCNKCQTELADIWLTNVKERLLDVHHFLVTFTLPDSLRVAARSNQKVFYNLLFKTSSQSLQSIAYDTKYVGAKLGIIAVLHTWARNLLYHPHVHFLVSAGGLFEDENIWMPAKDDFLAPVKALSVIFRAKFKDALKHENQALFETIPNNTWTNKWVVHSQTVGSGEKALSYLARYIFRPAISNTNIISFKNGKVKFRFKNSQTKKWQIMELQALEFIRRYLQHVLPKGFVKVRYYGLYAHACKMKLSKVPTKHMKKSITQIENNKIHCCPKCNNPLILIQEFEKMYFFKNGPPKNDVLLNAIYQKLNSPYYLG